MVFYDSSTKTIYESSIITNIPYATFVQDQGWNVYKDDKSTAKKCIKSYEELKEIYIKRGYQFKKLSEYPTPYLSNYTIIDEIKKDQFLLSNGQIVSDFYLSHSTIADRIYYNPKQNTFIRFDNKNNHYDASPFLNKKMTGWEISKSKNLYNLLPYSEDVLLKLQEPKHIKDLLVKNYKKLNKNKSIVSPIIPKECSKLQLLGIKVGELTDYRHLAKKLGLTHENLRYNGARVRNSNHTYTIKTKSDRNLAISEDILIKILTSKNVKKQFTFEYFNKNKTCTIDLWEVVRLYKNIKKKLKKTVKTNNENKIFREYSYDENLKKTIIIINITGNYEMNMMRYYYYINKTLNPIFESIGLEPLANVNSNYLDLPSQHFSDLLLGFNDPIRGLVVYKGKKQNNNLGKQIVHLYIDIKTRKTATIRNSYYIYENDVKTIYQKWYENECLRKCYLEPFINEEYNIMSYDEFYDKIRNFIVISKPPIKYKNKYYYTKSELAKVYKVSLSHIYNITKLKNINFFQALDYILEKRSLERI